MNIGFDGGFYATKAICGDRVAQFESFAVRPAESLFPHFDHQAIIVSSEHGRYLCGAEAVKKAQVGARKETAQWVETPEYMSLFCAALSELTEATQATVNLVTGLPLADYRRDRQKVRDLLLGTHQFVREGNRGQSLTVETARVVPQAWGAVLALLLDDKGRIVELELTKQKIGVVDIGAHTVNYLSVDGLSDIPSETQGTERGAWNLVRVVREHLENSTPGLARLSDHEVMTAITSGETYDEGERVDLAAITKPVIDDIGQEIIDTASQYWGAGAATFRRVVVCGGGAYLWGEHIRRAFRQAVVLDKPELANATGFYRFAVNQASKG